MSQNYRYIAYQQQRKVRGTLSANTLTAAMLALKQQGFTNVNLQRHSQSRLALTSFFNKRIRAKDICIFTRQLATMQHAGIPLVTALTLIQASSKHKPLYALLAKIIAQLEDGFALATTLRAHPSQFDNLYCNLIETGEAAGKLALLLDRIATYLEKRAQLTRQLQKAAYYPLSIIGVAVSITMVLLIKVVPVFKQLFDNCGAELPTFTQQILYLAETAQAHWIKFIIISLVISRYLIKLYRTHLGFKTYVQRISMHLPLLGKILQHGAITSFANTLATTIAAGVTLPAALLLTAKSNPNTAYYQAIIKVRDLVVQGESINHAMHSTRLFPPLVTQMVGIGEHSGSLESVLLKIAEIYSAELDVAMTRMTTLLEPLIMVILSVLVGGLVIAMYLPIFSLGSVF